jgi:hypothetical protein
MAAVAGWIAACLATGAGEGRHAAAGSGVPAELKLGREDDGDPASGQGGGLRALLGRLVEALEEQGTLLRERVEGLTATYRLLRAMGMSRPHRRAGAHAAGPASRRPGAGA